MALRFLKSLRLCTCALKTNASITQKTFSFQPEKWKFKENTRNHYFNIRTYCTEVTEDSHDVIVRELCGDDAALEQKLRILMLEVQVMREDGRSAPQNLSKYNWKHLLELPTRSQRSKYLLFLFKTEKAKENEKQKKEAKRRLYDEGKLTPQTFKKHSDDLEYGLQYNAMLLRIGDGSINNYYNFRAMQAMLYGQSLILDCSYENEMVFREATNAAKQLTHLFGDNRIHKSPFDLHLCNADINGRIMSQLLINIPTVQEKWFPLNITQHSYLEMFPKEKLVYLTPHCREELVEYDHDAVYIVGCMVDKVNNEPLSLARAKRDGIKMAKLPLDRYLEWAPGSGKTLNINHMVNILLDMKTSNDWEYSLRHVPKRKLLNTHLMREENQLKKRNPTLYENLKKNEFGRKKFVARKFDGRKEGVYKRLLGNSDSL